MKRTISIFLSLLMLFSVLGGMTIQTQAATKVATLLWPVRDKNTHEPLKTISTHHGKHHGIDIKAEKGQLWYAAYDGVVYDVYRGCNTNAEGNHKKKCKPNHKHKETTYKGTCNYGLGNGVIIKCKINNKTYYMQYAHMGSVSGEVKKGQTIKKGTYLGTVGDRGYSFGAHAHFEINKDKPFKNYCNNDITSKKCIFNYEDYLTVKFDGNGGTVSCTSLKINPGKTLGRNIPSATRAGYTFVGWYDAKSGGKWYGTSSQLTNITLFAHWEKSPTGILQKGHIYKILNPYSKKVLQASSASNRASITLQKNSLDSKQLFKVAAAGEDGCYKFVLADNPDLALDMDSNYAVKSKYDCGAALQLYASGNAGAQYFSIIKRGNQFVIQSKNTGRVLDCVGAKKDVNTRIQQYYFGNGENQKFYFVDVTDVFTFASVSTIDLDKISDRDLYAYLGIPYNSSTSNNSVATTNSTGSQSSTTKATTKKASITLPTVSVKTVSKLTKNSVQINFTANNPSKVTIKKVGVQVRKKGTSTWKTKTEAMNSKYVNAASTPMWWTVGKNKELNMTLSANTTYEYRAYVVYNGKNYYSATKTFTTKKS
mgnify:CR=1 FL=1